MQIEVTAKDIEDGVRKDETRCPIALALKRAFPDVDIRVGYDVIGIGKKYYRTNRILKNFINDYDHETSVNSFVFNLSSLRRTTIICSRCQHPLYLHHFTCKIEGISQYTCTCGSKCSGTEFKYKGT